MTVCSKLVWLVSSRKTPDALASAQPRQQQEPQPYHSSSAYCISFFAAMRLLNARTKKLSEYFDANRPSYAILSHTWGIEEVTFEEINRDSDEQEQPASSNIAAKQGYKKIEGCCAQALQDGFEWVWVDTCCIDKSSSAELSEAINSMFAWYRDSAVCYALLSDVPDNSEDIAAAASRFRASRWFTRGWTLQELLAPTQLRFFTEDWNLLGELARESLLSSVVSETTRIPATFFQGGGHGLETANVAQKMSWASKRVTTRTEDVAYSLLGIFGINMPLVYGEGANAFRRLQEEIIRTTHDHTLFAWGLFPWNPGYSDSLARSAECDVLAKSPRDFLHCGDLLPFRNTSEPELSSYQMTNLGLRIQTQLKFVYSRLFNARAIAFLDCVSRHDPSKRIAIPLNAPSVESEGHLNKDLVFARNGSALHLEADPRANMLQSYEYSTRNILIAEGQAARPARSHQLKLTVELPRHFRVEIIRRNPDAGCEVAVDAVERGESALRVWNKGGLPGSLGWHAWVRPFELAIADIQLTPTASLEGTAESIVLSLRYHLRRTHTIKYALAPSANNSPVHELQAQRPRPPHPVAKDTSLTLGDSKISVDIFTLDRSHVLWKIKATPARQSVSLKPGLARWAGTLFSFARGCLFREVWNTHLTFPLIAYLVVFFALQYGSASGTAAVLGVEITVQFLEQALWILVLPFIFQLRRQPVPNGPADLVGVGIWAGLLFVTYLATTTPGQ